VILLLRPGQVSFLHFSPYENFFPFSLPDFFLATASLCFFFCSSSLALQLCLFKVVPSFPFSQFSLFGSRAGKGGRLRRCEGFLRPSLTSSLYFFFKGVLGFHPPALRVFFLFLFHRPPHFLRAFLVARKGRATTFIAFKPLHISLSSSPFAALAAVFVCLIPLFLFPAF